MRRSTCDKKGETERNCHPIEKMDNDLILRSVGFIARSHAYEPKWLWVPGPPVWVIKRKVIELGFAVLVIISPNADQNAKGQGVRGRRETMERITKGIKFLFLESRVREG